MKVVQLLEIIDVPEDYIRCSVCGKYHPIESFNNDNSKKTTRRNCFDCYSLPFDDMIKLKNQTDELYKTNDYGQLSITVSKENEIRNGTLTKNEMIEEIQKSLEEIKNLPDDVLFTQTFYDDYYGTSFNKPCFSKFFKKADKDYPCGYPTEINGFAVYYSY
jgi:DNA repair exonuclease SbcCD ATPase subunit